MGDREPTRIAKDWLKLIIPQSRFLSFNQPPALAQLGRTDGTGPLHDKG